MEPNESPRDDQTVPSLPQRSVDDQHQPSLPSDSPATPMLSNDGTERTAKESRFDPLHNVTVDQSVVVQEGNQATMTLGSDNKPRKVGPVPSDLPGYELQEELGRGGMGVVYKALQTRLNRPVAIKMILAGDYAGYDDRLRFLGEAEVVAKLQHPNIVQLYEFNLHKGIPYFSLEFVAGGTLDKILAKQPLTSEESASLIETLAGAVDYAHSKGVVHRDIKPGNILLHCHDTHHTPQHHTTIGSHDSSFGTLSCKLRGQSYVPKITDFGLAKQVEASSGLTRSGAIMGTPSYMAPEQAGGNTKEVTVAADIYALGAILYECLTGRPPFQAATPHDTIWQVVNEEPVPPKQLNPKIPRDLETICLKCLQKDPAKRYVKTQDLAQDLWRYLHQEPIQARPISWAERAIRWAKRRPTAAALASVTVLATTIIVVGSWISAVQLRNALEQAERQQKIAEDQKTIAEQQKNLAEAQKTLAEKREAEAKELRIMAETKKTEAEETAKELDKQRTRVSEELTKRLELVDDLIFNMDQRLANMNGTESIRREFINDVLKVSQQLVKENPNDPFVIRQAGRIHRSYGEVLTRFKQYNQANTAYKKAIELQSKLLKTPNHIPKDVVELAYSYSRQGSMYWQMRRYKEAIPIYGESIKYYEQVTDSAKKAEAEEKAALYRAYQANFYQELKQLDTAQKLYEEAYTRQKKLAEKQTRNASLLEDLGNTCSGLGWLIEPKQPDRAIQLLNEAWEAHGRAMRIAPNSRYTRNEFYARSDIQAFCMKHHRDADLLAMAKAYLQEKPDSPDYLYNMACYASLAAKTVLQNPHLDSDKKKTVSDEHAKQSLDYLQQAIDKGYIDRVHMLVDMDLDSLRERSDYKEFLSRLEKRFSGKPITPGDLLLQLEKLYYNQSTAHQSLNSVMATVFERQRAAREKPDFADFAQRILKITRSHPELPASMDALLWTLETGTNLQDPQANEVCKTLIKELQPFLKKPEVTNACRVLCENPSSSGDLFLKDVVDQNGDKDVQAVALYALGMSLALQAEKATPGSADQSRLSRQAEEYLDKVAKEHAMVLYQSSTLGDLVRRKLHEIRSLSVGREARDIEGIDLTGKPMKLSDYRGQVVLLDFWANWCGFCRQMYEHEKQMVNQYKDRPFVLLGVNCDEEKDNAQRAVDRYKLNWRSWWDGGDNNGHITELWQVDAFPTIYLIDAKGIIRHKWQGKPEPEEIETAIQQLLKEVEKKK